MSPDNPMSRGRGRRAPSSEFFAQILMEEGILQPEDLKRVIDIQAAQPPETRQPVGRLVVEQGFLDRPTLLALLDKHGHRLHLGELLVLRGLLPLGALETAVREQRNTGEMLGEVLLRLGLISQTALAEGLAEQCGVAFVPISQIPADPALSKFISGPFAIMNGIVPIAARNRTLTVAVWQPRSLVTAGDLEQATGLYVHVVLTTRQEVEARIEALYGPRIHRTAEAA